MSSASNGILQVSWGVCFLSKMGSSRWNPQENEKWNRTQLGPGMLDMRVGGSSVQCESLCCDSEYIMGSHSIMVQSMVRATTFMFPWFGNSNVGQLPGAPHPLRGSKLVEHVRERRQHYPETTNVVPCWGMTCCLLGGQSYSIEPEK